MVMAYGPGWDPPGPPLGEEGRPTLLKWMGGGNIGQLQVLSIATKDSNKKLNPFIVGRSLTELVGDIEGTTSEANGTKYVLRVRDARQTKKLLGMTALIDGTAVSVTLHPVLNSRRCVISCRDIIDETEEDLGKWLASEGVIGVRRITRMVDGIRVNTPTVILTINGTSTPEYLKIGALRVKTRQYIPDPVICYRCFTYGHTKLRCKGEAKCRNCSKPHNLESECTANAFCMHCKGPHSPSSRSCPQYQQEKEIVRLRFSKGISHAEAVNQMKSGGGTYAAVSQVQQRLTTARDAISESEKQKDKLILQLTETIALLTKRIEDLETKKSKKERKKKTKEMKTDEEMEYETGSELEVDTTNTADKAGAPRASEASSQVSGAKPKQNVPGIFKRQLTSSELALPSKKINDNTILPPATPQPTPKQTQPRSQTQNKTGQQHPPSRK